MRIVFMGTPDFAVPCLEALVQAGHDVAGVFSQPDRPRGRGGRVQAPPVKQAAQAHGIAVFQPTGLKSPEVTQTLRSLAPEAIVVVAYGRILPPAVLDIPPHGCINVHASLLPKLRGAAPIQWAIINGETVTGVTTMKMDTGLDTGDMLLKAKTPINDNDTTVTLSKRLCEMGAGLLLETLDKLEAETLQMHKQDDAAATYASMIDRAMADIDWSWPAQRIDRLIRGLQPWPVACTWAGDMRIKIHQACVSAVSGLLPGQVSVDEGLTVGCGEQTALELVTIQRDGARPMSVADFLRGHPIAQGTLLTRRVCEKE